jgi:hypothetical protein
MSALPSVIPFRHDFRQTEEFRADLQAGAVRRKTVDFKMNFVPFERQVDDPTEHGEPLGFANRQSA